MKTTLAQIHSSCNSARVQLHQQRSWHRFRMCVTGNYLTNSAQEKAWEGHISKLQVRFSPLCVESCPTLAESCPGSYLVISQA